MVSVVCGGDYTKPPRRVGNRKASLHCLAYIFGLLAIFLRLLLKCLSETKPIRMKWQSFADHIFIFFSKNTDIPEVSSTRCPPAVRSWRRAKNVSHLCEVYHFAPLCLVHVQKSLQLCSMHVNCTCTIHHNIPCHARALVELYQCTKVRVVSSKFPESKGAYSCAECTCN